MARLWPGLHRRPLSTALAGFAVFLVLRMLARRSCRYITGGNRLNAIALPPHAAAGYKLVFKHGVVTYPDGLQVLVHHSTQEYGEQTSRFWSNMSAGGWEKNTFEAFKNCVTRETDVLDFGSWIGPTVLYAAGLGAAQVLAFEPDPAAAAELQVNIGLNGFGQVKLHQACIGRNDGPLPLYSRDGSLISNSVAEAKQSWFSSVSDEHKIPCYTVQTVLEEYHQPTQPLFIKIDTEGFEVDLLPTLKDIFLAYRPAVHLSIHPHLRELGDAEWSAVCRAVVPFPRAFVAQTGPPGSAAAGPGWKKAVFKEEADCIEQLKEEGVTEVLLSWGQEQCAGVVSPQQQKVASRQQLL